MAQLMFETVPASALGDSDLFHCGKCKKQFLSIEVFVNHKNECNNSATSTMMDLSLPSNVCGVSQNTVLVQKIQIPSSTISNYPQSLVFTEADLLQLSAAGLDPNSTTTATASNSTINVTPGHTVIPQATFTSQTLPATVQHVLQQVSNQDPNQTQTVELSIINDKFVTRPIFLTGQQHSSAISGVVLNLSTPNEQASVLCSNLEPEKSGHIIVEAPTCQTLDSGNNNDQNGNDKEPSTVNIITEFHSSMVKTKKSSVESENDENQNKKDSKLNCAYCYKSFTKNFDLQQHIRCHTGEKPFQCIVCGRAFAQKSNVKKHMQTHKVWPDGLAKTLPHLVSKNNSSCSDEGEITNENNQISPDEPDQHNEPEQETTASGEVDKSSYACPYCPFIGNSYYKLKSHMKQHDTEKVYKCILSSCGQMFNELDPFLDHTKTHENEMTYRCHECNKNFETLFALGSHQFSHSLYPNSGSRTSRRFFQCNLCLNKYSTPAALNHHLATSSHTYSCKWCDKVFPCERYLRRHLHIHSESESFFCNVCGKGFKTEGYLKVHMLVHSEERPFECSVCKAAFNRKDKLKRHLLIHEPVKKYKCPFRTHSGCSKEFNRADKLKSHILTHSCIKPFTCKTCDKNFTRKAHLREHEKLNHHSGDFKLSTEEELVEEKCSSALSLSDSDDSKFSKYIKTTSSKRSSRFRRQKKKTIYLNSYRNGYDLKRKGRYKKHLCLSDFEEPDTFDSNSEMADDIPTAHIEIISTHGIVGNSELSQISLTPDMSYSDLQLYPVEEETNIPEGSPISVEIHSTNSNSLLSSDLQSTADIADYS